MVVVDRKSLWVLWVTTLVVASLIVPISASAKEAQLVVGFDPDPGPKVDVELPELTYRHGLDERSIAEYAELYGLSASEATVQIEIEQTLISRNPKEQLRAEELGTFAGMWMQHNPAVVYVAFTVDAAARVEKLVAEIPELSLVLRAVDAEFSLAELEDASTSIGLRHEARELPEGLQDSLVGTWLDEPGNRVVVEVLRKDEARAKQAVELLSEAAVVDVVVVDETPETRNDAFDVFAGQSMVSCTAGFVVRKLGSVEAGLTTAGHCSSTVVSGASGLELGPRFREVDDGLQLDAEWLGLSERDWRPRNWTIVGPSSTDVATVTARASYWSLMVGTTICKYGITTGRTCGAITSWQQGAKRFIESWYYSQPGDSGSPVTYQASPGTAVGIHKGRAGQFAQASSITWLEGSFGVSIATSALPSPAYDWFLRYTNSQGGADHVWEFGESGSTAVAGRWMTNNGGRDQPGFFKNGVWDLEGRARFSYGSSGDRAVVGDWDSDDIDEVGVFRPSNARFYRYGTSSIAYGNSGDLPVAGDWDGDGDDEIGVWRPSQARFYLRNSNGTTSAYYYGTYGDLPVIGDWDDDGDDDYGVFRPSTGQWFLQGYSGFYYGIPTDKPLPGDWTGDGRDTPGVVR